MNLPGRRRDHDDGSLLRRLDDFGRQLHIPSDDVDDDVERKRPKDGCPMPWKHCRTLARFLELEQPE